MKERIMELGERRRVTLVLWMEDGARWQLTAEIQPESRGDYRLTYQFGLGTEIIRRSIPIRVV